MVQVRTIFGFLRHFVVILVLLARCSLISDGIIQTTRQRYYTTTLQARPKAPTTGSVFLSLCGPTQKASESIRDPIIMWLTDSGGMKDPKMGPDPLSSGPQGSDSY